MWGFRNKVLGAYLRPQYQILTDEIMSVEYFLIWNKVKNLLSNKFLAKCRYSELRFTLFTSLRPLTVLKNSQSIKVKFLLSAQHDLSPQ